MARLKKKRQKLATKKKTKLEGKKGKIDKIWQKRKSRQINVEIKQNKNIIKSKKTKKGQTRRKMVNNTKCVPPFKKIKDKGPKTAKIGCFRKKCQK